MLRDLPAVTPAAGLPTPACGRYRAVVAGHQLR